MKPSPLHDLVFDNPMLFEATRTARRLCRIGNETNRVVCGVVLGLISLLYVWLLFVILHYREDMSQMLLVLEAIVLTIAVPASLYGAISGEREKLTWDALIMTRLTPAQILGGKVIWRVGGVLLIAALYMPPLLLCHMVGAKHGQAYSYGMEYPTAGLWAAQGVNIAWGLLLIGFSLWVSSATKRSVTTLALLAGSLFTFLVIVPALYTLFGGAQVRVPQREHNLLYVVGQWLVQAHPLVAVDTLRHLGESYEPWQVWRFSPGITAALPIPFLAGMVWFLFLSLRRLRGMELPGQDRR